MNQGLKYFLISVVAVAVIGVGAFLVSLYYQAGSGEASAPISAPQLSLDEATATVAATDAATATPQATPMAEAATPTAEPTAAPAAERRLYRIAQDGSEVRFELDEELFGAPKHVVGSTDQVAGDVIIDLANPANSEVGVIRINARTFATDNDFRNRAVRGAILQTNQAAYEFIEFTPTALDGLPATAEVGTTYEFTITGDLKIRDVVRSVTFDASVTLVDGSRLEGTARTTVLRSDFGLEIPEVPNVANVTEEVLLIINFVAPEVAQ